MTVNLLSSNGLVFLVDDIEGQQCFRGHAYLTEATLMRRFKYTKTSAMLRPCNHHKCG